MPLEKTLCGFRVPNLHRAVERIMAPKGEKMEEHAKTLNNCHTVLMY
jgi:hypothetical protein